MLNTKASIQDFENIYNDIGNKKIKDLDIREIAKYLLVTEELDWMDNNVGDDKVFYTFDERLLDNLSYQLGDSIFTLINENYLYNYDLHTEPVMDEMEY